MTSHCRPAHKLQDQTKRSRKDCGRPEPAAFLVRECVSKLSLHVAPGDEGAAEREKGFVDVRAVFVAQREAAEAMQPGQGAFDNLAEDDVCARLGLTRFSQPLPLAGFQTFGDTLRSGRRRIHETTTERQDASAIHRLTPRRSCEDDRDGARTGEQAHSARLR
jgi:hypothetical protein